MLGRHGYDVDNEPTRILGPSTDNKIERLWRDLREKMIDRIKPVLKNLLDEGHYDQDCPVDREIMAGVFIPLVQKELDWFKDQHNSSR